MISDDSLLIISALKKEYLTFIIYLKKTHKDGLIRTEIKTPIIRIAYDIIMKYKGRLPSNALLPYYPDGNGRNRVQLSK